MNERVKTMIVRATILAALATTAATAATAPPPSIVGVWAIGETANCATGNAWVLHADGYYVEIALPDKGPKAVGMWKDEGAIIAYTHSHMPFADMASGAPPRKFTVEARTSDRLTMKTYRGTPIIFNRCPADAVKAPTGGAEH
jgi:hypothetical protein